MSLSEIYQYVTDFGDSGITSTAAIVCAAYLVACRSYREGVSLFAALTASAACISVLKIVMFRCGSGPLVSPSGHAALSVAVYSTIWLVIARGLDKKARLAGSIVCVTLLASICITRVTLGYHTVQEVVAGTLVGGFIAAIMNNAWFRRAPVKRYNSSMLICICAVDGIVMHGIRPPAEAWLHSFAGTLSSTLSSCENAI